MTVADIFCISSLFFLRRRCQYGRPDGQRYLGSNEGHLIKALKTVACCQPRDDSEERVSGDLIEISKGIVPAGELYRAKARGGES